MSRLGLERNQKVLLELAAKSGNDVCADCKARNPRWASYNLGIFICMNCAGIHRKIGTHITKVKSLTMDSWTKEQVERMREIGNVKSNSLYNPNESRHPPPANMMDAERDSELESYIRSKYEFKRFLQKYGASTDPPPQRTAPASTSGKSSSRSVPLSGSPPTSLSTSTASQQRPSTVPASSNPTPTSQHTPVPARAPPENPPSTVANGLNQPAGVWADLISLQPPAQNSSLPLQIQAPITQPLMPQQTSFTGGLATYPSGIGIGTAHLQQLGTTYLPQQPSFSSGQMGMPGYASGPTVFANQQLNYPQPIQVQATSHPQFLQPQPQHAVTLGGGGVALVSASPGLAGPFISASPALHGTTPQPGVLSTTPQLQMQPMPVQMGPFMTPSPQLQVQASGPGMGIGVGMGMGMGIGASQPPFFSGPQQVQMQQQPGYFVAQQPQMGQFGMVQMQPMQAQAFQR